MISSCPVCFRQQAVVPEADRLYVGVLWNADPHHVAGGTEFPGRGRRLCPARHQLGDRFRGDVVDRGLESRGGQVGGDGLALISEADEADANRHGRLLPSKWCPDPITVYIAGEWYFG